MGKKIAWITRSYAFSYWATSRIYQLARENIGFSAQLGGTGMVFSASVLKEMGWEAKSLTEDLEFTVKYHLERNKRVACHCIRGDCKASGRYFGIEHGDDE